MSEEQIALLDETPEVLEYFMLSCSWLIREIRLNLDMRSEYDLCGRILLFDQRDQSCQLRIIDHD